jgi:hypothetical protein
MRVLVRNGFILIDESDYPKMRGYDWWISRRRTNTYVMGTTGRMGKLVYLHRVILGLSKGDGVEVDHIDCDGTNNSRCNLRVVPTHTENLANRRKFTGTSKYKGVHWATNEKKWHSTLSYKDRTVYVGYFDDEDDAARAYNEMAVRMFGVDYARINVINNE